MPDNNTSQTSPFGAIRQTDKEGREYWSARDMAQLLGYTQWRNFTYALKKVQVACEKSGEDPADHFAASSKMVSLGSGSLHKDLKKGQKILDYMGSDELAYNSFRASLTRQKIEREHITEKGKANQAHHTTGKRIRDFIKEDGSTMPENLPIPDKSIQQLQSEQQKRIERQQQPSLFDQNEE